MWLVIFFSLNAFKNPHQDSHWSVLARIFLPLIKGYDKKALFFRNPLQSLRKSDILSTGRRLSGCIRECPLHFFMQVLSSARTVARLILFWCFFGLKKSPFFAGASCNLRGNLIYCPQGRRSSGCMRECLLHFFMQSCHLPERQLASLILLYMKFLKMSTGFLENVEKFNANYPDQVQTRMFRHGWTICHPKQKQYLFFHLNEEMVPKLKRLLDHHRSALNGS